MEVWECPDIFKLKVETLTKKWVLFISINPGAPQGGSELNILLNFDGKTLQPRKMTLSGSIMERIITLV
jgi:fructan beta-fructosidase